MIQVVDPPVAGLARPTQVLRPCAKDLLCIIRANIEVGMTELPTDAAFILHGPAYISYLVCLLMLRLSQVSAVLSLSSGNLAGYR